MRQLVKLLHLQILDLWRSRRNLALTYIALTLGFWALVTSLSLKDSQLHLVRTQARQLLTGDFQVSSTRPLAETELEQIRNVYLPSVISLETELLATLRFSDKASLVDLKAITKVFPTVGEIKLGDGIADPGTLSHKLIWLAKELAEELKITVGDEVRVGESNFKVSGLIEADVGAKRGAVGFAPRAYIHREDLAGTNLVQPGSQVQYRATMTLPSGTDLDKARVRLENWPEELVLRTPNDAVAGVKRAIQFVERFVSLLTLFLALLGFVTGFYLLQIHLRERAGIFALYEILGAKHSSVALAAFAQVVLILFASWSTAWLIVLAQIRALNPSLRAVLPGGGELVVTEVSLLLSLVLLAGNFLMFGLPFLIRLKQMALDQLLNHSAPSLPVIGWRRDFFSILVALGSYMALAAWLLSSVAIAGALIVTLVMLLLVSGWLLPKLLRLAIAMFHPEGMTRVVVLGLSRPRLLLALIWLGLGWSAAIGSAIPNLYEVARQEIHTPSVKELPQLFAININEEDLKPFSAAVSSAGGDLRHASPLLLARVIKQNGQVPTDDGIRRRPVRLTYRAELTEAETLVAGKPLDKTFTPGEKLGISVEKEFAQRTSLKLGDELEFEIAGVKMTAFIQNLREVKWSSFQPNFFLQFPPGVLEEYPKSFLAVIYGLETDRLFSTQASLANQFPTLSLLNLATTIERLKDLTDNLGWPILGITGLALIVTALLLSMLSWHQWRERKSERLLFSWIGASTKWLKSAGWLESLLWSGSALVFGLLLGNLLSVVSSQILFETWRWPDFRIQLVIVLVGAILSVWPLWRKSNI